MQNETRLVFDAYTQHVAKLNGVASVSAKFSVTPSVQQKLESKIQESADFLGKINLIGVTEQAGEALLLGVGGPIASRTNTSAGHRREPGVRGVFTKDTYRCVQTNYDGSFPYALIDAWAKFPDFQLRLQRAIAERQALDRIMIGFHGKTAAPHSDLTANPLLQDINIGWLEKLRTNASDRILDEVEEGSGKVTIGAGGDYAHLDSLVYDALQILDPWNRARPDLVVMVSRNLFHSKMLRVIDQGAASNQEANAGGEIVARARLAGLPIVDVPYFPDGTVLITTLSNLSIYYQTGTRRRHLCDEPHYDRIADYQSSNDAYVIEDFGLVALVENISMVDAA